MDEIVSWETDFMPVEAAVAAGTMEITVSKFDLLRELNRHARCARAQDHHPILSTYSRPLETACLDASG
jgi:hypothetical protein